ncbi:MAG: fumarylacetoacetate hydrolase family protein [Acidimicrobiia bacterium]
MTTPGWDDPVVGEAMRRMLDQRRRVLERGEGTIGWKLAFGAPVWLEKLGLTGPLVGFLPESSRKAPGSTISCQGWVDPVAEPEIAVYLGSDVLEPDRVVESISGLGAAIELADVDSPVEDIGQVLEGNIFHRAVVLGPPDHSRVDGSVAGMRARISRNGSEIADTEDLEALTGRIVSVLGHTAALLRAAGERLGAGDVVIVGSVIQPIKVHPGDEITFELVPLSPISVSV